MAHPSKSFTIDLKGDEHGNHANDEVRERSIKVNMNALFPVKLHSILTAVEEIGLSDIVSWAPHGRCFKIHKPQEFFEQIVTRFFKQSTLASFHRQLNLYEFQRLNRGVDDGSYFHELFVKGHPSLAKRMTRTKVKGAHAKRTRIKASILSGSEQKTDFDANTPLESYPLLESISLGSEHLKATTATRELETEVEAMVETEVEAEDAHTNSLTKPEHSSLVSPFNNTTVTVPLEDTRTHSHTVSGPESYLPINLAIDRTDATQLHDSERGHALEMIAATETMLGGDRVLDSMVAELLDRGDRLGDYTVMNDLTEDLPYNRDLDNHGL